ncbi:MAG: glycosyltransferase family 39 protein, partial [Acidobacteriaceae bacterium]
MKARLAAPIPIWIVLPVLFLAVLAAHATLLRLPYFWDEAGYYIPAAYDFFRTGALVPYSTLSNAHPPLPSILLTVAWKLFHFAPVVTRTTMCLVAAVALAAVWRLALLTTGKTSVAAATVLLTGLYPVFFAQSSLAHADMFAAAATLWALVFFLEDKLLLTALVFTLAALAKETAIITPLALGVWESWRPHSHLRHRLGKIVALLAPVLPLGAWYVYHWHKTGFVFGNPQFLRYNATANLSPQRIAIAFTHRLAHLTTHMNMFVPVAAMLACLLLPPVAETETPPSDHEHLRRRIAPAYQAIFYVVLLANAVLFSILGGALLTRYLLPLYPLVLLLCVNTFRRHLRHWTGLVALSAAGFIAALFINPVYGFAPEDNLEYATFIRLHQAAIRQIVDHVPHPVVLSAWPATAELSVPFLGYVDHPIPVISIDDFAAHEIARAAALPPTWNAALVFSTKYDPPPRAHFTRRDDSQAPDQAIDTRYFGFHRDLPPALIAHLLGGAVAWQAASKGEWAAVLVFARQPGPTWAAYPASGPARATS